MSLPHTVQPMPTKGGFRKTEQPSYSHGGPAGSELGPVLACCRCKCGAVPVRVDGVLKLDCGCKR